MLDFHLGPVPEKWEDLRREALPIYRTLNLYEAELRPVSTAAQFL